MIFLFFLCVLKASGALGPAQTQLQSAPVNLADPTANATNVLSHATAPQQSLVQGK